MKIIVSSKALARTLNRLPSPVDFIETVGLGGDNVAVMLYANGVRACIHCAALDVKPHIRQTDRQWHTIYKIVNRIPDMPLTLNITEQSVDMTMNF